MVHSTCVAQLETRGLMLKAGNAMRDNYVPVSLTAPKMAVKANRRGENNTINDSGYTILDLTKQWELPKLDADKS